MPITTQRALGPGAPLGNRNALRHGLFSPHLGADGLAFYDAAKGLAPDKLAREAADFLVAKMAEAYRSDQEWTKAIALARESLRQMVDDGRIEEAAAAGLAAKLRAPDLSVLAKAFGPLRGLLEVKKILTTEGDDGALGILAVVVARSQARRNAAEQGDTGDANGEKPVGW